MIKPEFTVYKIPVESADGLLHYVTVFDDDPPLRELCQMTSLAWLNTIHLVTGSRPNTQARWVLGATPRRPPACSA
jgi:hypothetical protein